MLRDQLAHQAVRIDHDKGIATRCEVDDVLLPVLLGIDYQLVDSYWERWGHIAKDRQEVDVPRNDRVLFTSSPAVGNPNGRPKVGKDLVVFRIHRLRIVCVVWKRSDWLRLSYAGKQLRICRWYHSSRSMCLLNQNAEECLLVKT